MPLKQDLRVLALTWRGLGKTRTYFTIIGAVVLVLAGIGVWHLIAPARETESVGQNSALPVATSSAAPTPATQTATARVSPSVPAVSASPSPAPTERAVAITDVRQERRRGPRGETFVVATIGLASLKDIDRDELEIRISFFDLTPANEMRPTNAQVTYQWLTPVRDWSDPAPKFLTATYFKPRPPPWLRDRLHYGGFVVRVYCDGKLQDERSEPEGLIASLRSNASPPRPSSTVNPPSSPSSQTASSPAILNPPSSIHNSPSSPPSQTPSSSSDSLPKGIPVPGKPGFVSSPYDPKFLIDVRGFPPGTLVIDPNTNKPFRVP